MQLKKVATLPEMEEKENSTVTQAKLLAGINKGNFAFKNHVETKVVDAISPALLQARLHAGISKGACLLMIALCPCQYSRHGCIRT